MEDEKDLRDILTKRLRKHYTVDACGDGEEALDYFSIYKYDVVILDIMLPKIDGLQVLRKIRSSGSETPVIMLTAKGEVEDKVSGLDAGADDYIVKPFAFDELLARIRVMTRKKSSVKSFVITVGDITLDTASKTVTHGGVPVSLTSKEYMLLEYMMRHPGLTLTRTQLEEQAWDSSFEGGSNVVDVYIRYLEKSSMINTTSSI